ncbi:hypothetical protein ACVWZ8_004700 [Arthrobacter sp. UYCu723]
MIEVELLRSLWAGNLAALIGVAAPEASCTETSQERTAARYSSSTNRSPGPAPIADSSAPWRRGWRKRQHPGFDEPRGRRGHHQHLRRVALPLTDGQRLMRDQRSHRTWNPAHGPGRQSARVMRRISRPDHGDLRPEQRRGTRPATRPVRVAAGIVGVFTNNSRTLGAHIKTRHTRCPPVLRRPINRSAGNTHDPDDLPRRVLTRRKQVAYVRPASAMDAGPIFDWRQHVCLKHPARGSL